MAVTTSTRDSGLLDELIPMFEEQRKARVDILAVGTGAALKLGEQGDVDVVWVHSRKAEDEFMDTGHGSRREDVMFNTFEILGPLNDPAHIKGKTAADTLKSIVSSGSKFVSRGDDSGTHKREQQLWKQAEISPEWDEYIESGQGMGASLNMADQMQAYILCDRGTYLNFSEKIELVPLVSGDASLKNPYGILVVNPDKNKSINGDLANTFVDFIISRPAQEVIRDYQINGEKLFYPLRLE